MFICAFHREISSFSIFIPIFIKLRSYKSELEAAKSCCQRVMSAKDGSYKICGFESSSQLAGCVLQRLLRQGFVLLI